MQSLNRQEKIKRLRDNKTELVVVLEDIHDPHNAAAVWRSCDAFGIKKVCLIFDQEEEFDPKSLGGAASSSANKWLEFEIYKSAEECINKIKEEGYRIYGTVLNKKAKTLNEIKFVKKSAICFGNEHQGLSEKMVKLMDENIYIEMKGMVQSLNLSVTAGICMWEYGRQREELG